jgi:hypothetical protein
MVEEYKIIKDFPNYEVSSFGNIRNKKTGRILKPGITTHGYYKVILYKDRISFNKTIHKLVGESFLPNPYNKQCVDHIDNNKLNNNISNLRYCTQQENCMNRKIGSKNTSNYKGISYDNQRNKWRAGIKINGKEYNLGRFDKIEDAINARVKKAKEIFGDYINSCEKEVTINLNIPANTKVNLNINIKPKEDQELEELEKEFNDILKAK